VEECKGPGLKIRKRIRIQTKNQNGRKRVTGRIMQGTQQRETKD
jgi:hypothetical protein